MSSHITRIMAEIKEYQKQIDNNGGKEGLNKFWIKFDCEELTLFEILILGPEDTPYEAGWFHFTGKFPDNYPNAPPELTFRTTNQNRIRFHPNLYETGKVCLSILGTWSGQAWTPVMTLETVCLSLRSIMNDNPITNEPGFENENITSVRARNYICSATYNTIKYALIDHWNQNTNLPEEFQSIVTFNMYSGIGLYGYYRKLVEGYQAAYSNSQLRSENDSSIASIGPYAMMASSMKLHVFDWKSLLKELSIYVGDWCLESENMELSEYEF